jgi:thiol-disulfide isomerase/thioredoxin
MKSKIVAILTTVVVALLPATAGWKDFAELASMRRTLGTVTAPEFPAGMSWLNTDRPLTLRQLRGKIVLLDFWTYCCINCMHILPDLKRLEQKYPDVLVVIGVHSAKFTNEGETEQIRRAILRYEIGHPVVNDRDFKIWRAYGASAWPTTVLIDPQGKVAGMRSGEGVFTAWDKTISGMVEEFSARGSLDRTPLSLKLEKSSQPESLLSFPGKVLADEASDRLFISDSNHNRIVVASLQNGQVREVIGKGDIGDADGAFPEASFHHPQGLALAGGMLYVADTENHKIRRVDFERKLVETIAGTGAQATFRSGGGPALTTALNSPWDLVEVADRLYIAMAGNHQIWVLDLAAKTVHPYAGSGWEARRDGDLTSAALAQPSGITTDGARLYFADSEASAVRWADLPPRDRVGTVVGEDLFVFGDRDGRGDDVLLQHPLGITFYQGSLYLADTYNHKVKKIHPEDRSAITLFGSGRAGWQDGGDAAFDEPGGISAAHGRLYIADTNNHLIRVADLQTRRVSTFVLADVDRLTRIEAEPGRIEPQKLPLRSLRPGEVVLKVDVKFPAGFKLNAQAPTRLNVKTACMDVTFRGGIRELSLEVGSFPVEIPLAVSRGDMELELELDLYYCREDREALCFFREIHLLQPLKVTAEAKQTTVEVLCEL